MNAKHEGPVKCRVEWMVVLKVQDQSSIKHRPGRSRAGAELSRIHQVANRIIVELRHRSTRTQEVCVDPTPREHLIYAISAFCGPAFYLSLLRLLRPWL
jgi:hypothetical protein